MNNPIYHQLPGMEWKVYYAYKKGGYYHEDYVVVNADRLLDAAVQAGKVVAEIAAQNEWEEFLLSDMNLIGDPDDEDCFAPIF